jgi:hypothetical protein
MQTFEVDDDLVALIWEKANPKPFEQLTFSSALRKVLTQPAPGLDLDSLNAMSDIDTDALLEELMKMKRERTKSPSVSTWIAQIPELNPIKEVKEWVRVCNYLGIDVGSDSARRKLAAWVKQNKKYWPPVPELES